MDKKITFRRPDGRECSGYFAAAGQGEGAPGMVVIQEWWGLNEQIKGVAKRLTEAGFQALVPDLYRGKVTLEAAEAEHLMEGLDFRDAAAQDIRGAVQYLKSKTSKAGVIGFCMGGVLSILAAVYVKEADAAVSWYGLPPEGSADTGMIKIPVQGHFALKDQFFTPAQVDELEASFKSGQIDYEIYRYAADHAFGNETGDHYDPAAAKLAWRRTLDFLKRHLAL
ncbi:MAG: dienelactone hydrolase family protein [Desulfobacterales bacterium]|jgi:carboxymethylenebutenolidase